MNKTLKWILGIAAVVLLVGAMFAVGFMWRSHMLVNFPDRAWNTPMMGRGNHDWQMQPRMNQRFENWKNPMMNSRRFMPFGGFFLFGGLVKFALFVGLLYGAYWLGRRNARIAIDPAPSARVDASAPLKTPEQDS